MEDRVLVVEHLAPGGGYVAFCGAVSDGGHPDAYVCAQLGQEIPTSTANLLVKALHGWLSGPQAAAKLAAAAAAAGLAEAAGGAMAIGEQFSYGGVSLSGIVGGAQDAEEVGNRGEGAGEEEGQGEEVQEEEMVDWVDTKGRVICALPRAVVHSNNVLHRGAGVMIRNDKVGGRAVYQYLTQNSIQHGTHVERRQKIGKYILLLNRKIAKVYMSRRCFMHYDFYADHNKQSTKKKCLCKLCSSKVLV